MADLRNPRLFSLLPSQPNQRRVQSASPLPLPILLPYQAANTVRRVHYQRLHKVGTPRVFLPISPSPIPVPRRIDHAKIYIE